MFNIVWTDGTATYSNTVPAKSVFSAIEYVKFFHAKNKFEFILGSKI